MAKQVAGVIKTVKDFDCSVEIETKSGMISAYFSDIENLPKNTSPMTGETVLVKKKKGNGYSIMLCC